MSHLHATFTMKVCLLLLVLAVCAGVALLATARRHQTARVVVAMAIIAGSGSWLRISKPIEGIVLKSFSKTHGVTVADLIVIPCLAVAAGLLWVARRDSSRLQAAPRMAGETRES
ncbi:MAG: hypothetical protein QOG52_1667 [Frankiaceae bacterium]|jgi:hypothetical protein|nr:hypothetical protein [Frankiaceae bacterium]